MTTLTTVRYHMKVFNRLKIGTRLIVAFGFVLALLCAEAGMGIFQTSRVFDGTRAIGERWLPNVESLTQIRIFADDVSRRELRMLVTTDPKQVEQLRTLVNESVNNFTNALHDYGNRIVSPEEQHLYDAIKDGWTDYIKLDDTIQRLVAAGDSASLERARELEAGEGLRRFAIVRAALGEDIKLHLEGSLREVKRADLAFERMRSVTLTLSLFAICAGLILAWSITGSILQPLRRAVEVAETVASGDLTAEIKTHGTDELADLLRSLGNMNVRLHESVKNVLTGSETIATASSQIAAGNADLSQRTEEQAAALEQTAASMEELGAAVRRNTGAAGEGNALAVRASKNAQQGNVVVGRVVETMSGISQSSQEVAQIIAVIEGIAFQTNILALNAAVEAARAGEQGRGFAVVASEVRVLAQRSASAAKQIKALVQASVERVAQGTSLVTQAGETMTEILSSIEQVATLMNEISVASDKQNTGIEAVSIALSQMDDVTQKNSALVEQASAATQSMAEQATLLRATVSIFRVSVDKISPVAIAPMA